jgi:DNA-binding response OmpR family regulator
MVVEDERDLLRLVELYLKAWNFDVDTFDYPDEGLAGFQKNPALF